MKCRCGFEKTPLNVNNHKECAFIPDETVKLIDSLRASAAEKGAETERQATKIAELEVWASQVKIECKRLIDTTYSTAIHYRGQKLDSARENLKHFLSTPTGAKERVERAAIEEYEKFHGFKIGMTSSKNDELPTTLMLESLGDGSIGDYRLEKVFAKDGETVLLDQVSDKAVWEEAIKEVSMGRVVQNFGHVPTVRRALEWLMVDFRKRAEGRE